MRWALFTAVLVALVGGTLVAYNNLGTQPIEGDRITYDAVDEHTLRLAIEVQRDDPQRPAACVVRARGGAGEEVGRKEVLVPPTDGTFRLETELRTTYEGKSGEVYGCTYNVPEYLSTHLRPTG
nr:DUF4307 domain-containing protein [Saccharopolyspora sp. HNM0983]